jgi:hypothetical protein
MPIADHAIIADPRRIETLRSFCLLDTPAEPAFDRLALLATRILHVPVALISLVDADRQFFKSQVGLPEPWAEKRETPLSHSFCQHVVVEAAPLIIEDAREHPLVQDNLAIPDLNVIAYAGIPLMTSNNVVLGSFCVIDDRPRVWTEDEIYILSELAASVMTEIELRSEIRERQRIEVTLGESEARYRQMIDTMQEGVMLLDPTGKILTNNPSAEVIMGMTTGQLQGQGTHDTNWKLVMEDGTPLNSADHPVAITLRTGQPQSNFVLGVYHPQKQLIWVMVNTQPLFHHGAEQPYAILTTFVDITERKAVEKQALELEMEKARVHVMAEFIEKSSHEFMTPLSIIQSSSDIIRRVSDPQKINQKVAAIHEQIERITRLVNNLQKISRLESTTTLSRQVADLTQMMKQIVEQYSTSRYDHVRYVFVSDPIVPKIPVDIENLRVAIVHVLDNAIRFSRSGDEIRICMEYKHEMVYIIIEDNGTGIPRQALPHIFERFFRLDKAHSTPGFGLGLPIARLIIEKHGGSIKVDSTIGVGTKVTMALPLDA